MPGNATPVRALVITSRAAPPRQPPSSSASGRRTHRDQALLPPQPPGHLHRGPPPRKRSLGPESACTPLQKDKRTEEPERWGQSETTQIAEGRGVVWCAEKTRALGSALTLGFSEAPLPFYRWWEDRLDETADLAPQRVGPQRGPPLLASLLKHQDFRRRLPSPQELTRLKKAEK